MIIIDDCSTDSSIQRIDSYNTDCLVKVFNEKNVGLSAVRNIGIKMAKGHHIAFLDSDDFYRPDFIEKMMNEVQGVDIAVCDYEAISKDGIVIDRYEEKTCNELIRGILNANNSTVVWNKVYKKSAIKEITFLEGVKNEDILFNIEVLMREAKVKFVREPMIFYRQLETSITKKYDISLVKDMCKVLNKIEEQCKVKYPVEFSQCYMYYYVFIGLKRVINCKLGFLSYISFIKSIKMENCSLTALKTGCYSFKQKVIILFLYFCKAILR